VVAGELSPTIDLNILLAPVGSSSLAELRKVGESCLLWGGFIETAVKFREGS
jgi:hypothetical protein